jgi:hypothetical protein
MAATDCALTSPYGQLENNVEHASLCIVEIEHAAKERRTDLAHGGSHRMSEFPVKIPQEHRRGVVGIVRNADVGYPLADFLVRSTSDRKTSHVALDVGHEDRHAQP